MENQQWHLQFQDLVWINGEDGIEVPNRDVQKYAEALKILASNAELRAKMGAAGKKRVENNFLNTQFRENILRAVGKL